MASNPTEPKEMSPVAGEVLFGGRVATTHRATSHRKSRPGLDVLLTKTAVDFQNPSATGDRLQAQHNLEALREAAGIDSIFIATFDAAHRRIESVVAATSLFATFDPDMFHGQSLDELPYLRDRLAHMRVVEIRDTARPRRGLARETARFASLHVGAVLMAGFASDGKVGGFIAMCSTLPRDSWDASLHLALKLIGSSYATGLELQRYRLHFENLDLDVTERKLFEEALFKEKESAHITLQSIGDGVITTDSQCRVEYLNPVAEHLTGWRLKHAQGRAIDEIFRSFHEETCELLENPLAVAIRRARAIKSVRPTLLMRRDGNELYIESCASPIRDGAGHVCGGVLVFHDVSESRELNRKLSYHASHDILTGLVNRHEFESRLERALKSACAREASYALCHIDLDQFKIVNDNAGHSAGDALLGQVGALLKSKISWRDTVARLGGDAFGVLLENCSLDEAIRKAEALRETIRSYRFVCEDRSFRLGASIGVVPISSENEDVATLLSAANSACAAAKECGRNRVCSFQKNDIDLMRRRREMQWAARINNALEDGRFEIFRQVIQPLQQPNAGLHYEMLLRMRDEAGTIVMPDQFISAAERYGLTPNIDRWMIEHALRWLVSQAGEREKLVLCSINLSGQSLGDDKFLPFVIDHFQRSGVDASKICFEITETAAIASFSQANRFIHALRELGCRFALDDFGTGLSSFGYLKHFPIDFLKIDGSFVKEILHDPIDREMVRSINEIGHLTGKQTIAEFAENHDIIEMLRNLGVDYAQGYGIATPQQVLRAVNA